MPHDSPRILLIEDEPVLAEVTGFRLELLGFEVETVASSEETFRATQRRMPEAIILNLGSPDMDGLALTERLSNDPRTSQIPILAISDRAGLDEVERAYAAGAKDYLVIPFNPIVLERKLGRLVQLAGIAK
ncbi:MAG: response regulator [Planctomycetes bacterium]|nr:response regulator [Planctomycetota bacterium]